MARRRISTGVALAAMLGAGCAELGGGTPFVSYQGQSASGLGNASLICMTHLRTSPLTSNTTRVGILDAVAPLVQRWWSAGGTASEEARYAQLAPYFTNPAVRRSTGGNNPVLLENCRTLIADTPEMAGIRF